MKLKKGFLKSFLITMTTFLIGMSNVFAAEVLTCDDPEVMSAIKIFSYGISVIKVVVPVILIIITTKNLVNAVLLQDDKAIMEQTSNFIKKAILAVFIFFIPTIINLFVGYTGKYDSTTGQYSKCAACLTNMNQCNINTGLLTEEQYTNMCDSLFGNPNTKPSVDADGKESRGSTAYYLQIALNIMKYAGIIVCIMLTIVDIVKTILNGDKDLVRPVVQKAFTRMIYAVLLFFMPIITEIIMSLIGVYGTCSLT